MSNDKVDNIQLIRLDLLSQSVMKLKMIIYTEKERIS